VERRTEEKQEVKSIVNRLHVSALAHVLLMPTVPALKVTTACLLDSVLHADPMLIVPALMATFGEVMEVKLPVKVYVMSLLVFAHLLAMETLVLARQTNVQVLHQTAIVTESALSVQVTLIALVTMVHHQLEQTPFVEPTESVLIHSTAEPRDLLP